MTNKINNQQAFDAALFGIRSQNYAKAMNEHGDCSYRGKNNTKCAIGHSLPDELYSTSIEGGTIRIIMREPVFKNFYSEVSVVLLTDMQRVHDAIGGYTQRKNFNNDPKDYFEFEMKKIAISWDLQYTKPV